MAVTIAASAAMDASTAAVVLTASRHDGATSLPASPTCMLYNMSADMLNSSVPPRHQRHSITHDFWMWHQRHCSIDMRSNTSVGRTLQQVWSAGRQQKLEVSSPCRRARRGCHAAGGAPPRHSQQLPPPAAPALAAACATQGTSRCPCNAFATTVRPPSFTD